MVKSILLKCDENMFNKMKEDKFAKEKKLNCSMTWEQYVYLIFGFSKRIII